MNEQIKEIVNYIVSKQSEYKNNTSAYNLARHLEEYIKGNFQKQLSQSVTDEEIEKMAKELTPCSDPNNPNLSFDQSMQCYDTYIEGFKDCAKWMRDKQSSHDRWISIIHDLEELQKSIESISRLNDEVWGEETEESFIQWYNDINNILSKIKQQYL